MDEIKEKVKQHSHLQSAYDKLREKYGETPDETILYRFYSEERYYFRKEERVKHLDLLTSLKKRAAELGEEVYSFGVEQSSLIAYLFGAVSENPLPLHYYCPKCKKVEYINEKKLPWDIPAKPCVCGGEMRADGFDIPFEAYKTTLIAPHICTSKKFAEETRRIIDEDIKIYPIDNLDTLQTMKKQYGAPTEKEVFESFDINDFSDILYLFFGISKTFTKELIEKTHPKNYYDLLQLFGFVHSKGAWHDNAEKLIGEGICGLSDIPTHHEDVLIQVKNKMRENDFEAKRFPHHVAFNVHYGRYATEGMSEEDETRLRELGFDEWFFDYIKKVTFMYSKTHSIVYFKQACELLWYKTNYSDICAV